MANGERWIDIPEFPDYEISDHGNVFSKRTNQPLVLSWNGRGTVKVNFSREGVLYTRSVRVLVAEAFVPVESADDSHREDLEVVNIDGDQTNNHYENLVWRPHWFAWKYTHQFREGVPEEYHVGLLNTQTGEVFDSVMAAGIADAVIWEYVYNSAITGRPVYPTGAVYEFVSSGTVSQIKQGL
jgi:NUMOD4 motif-containing protein